MSSNSTEGSEVSLRCIVIRHGWTRSFSISDKELEHLDYDSLARVLELAALKLRPNSLRIFVETSPGSGVFSKVKFWKDDGSFQSVLAKQFFHNNLENNNVMRFEIRDARERSREVQKIVTGDGSRVSKSGRSKRFTLTFHWLTGRRAPEPRPVRADGGVEAKSETESSAEKSPIARFLNYLFGPAPDSPPRGWSLLAHAESTPVRDTAAFVSPDQEEPVNERSALISASKRSSLRQKLFYAANNHGPWFSSGGPRTTAKKLTKSRTVKNSSDVSLVTSIAPASTPTYPQSRSSEEFSLLDPTVEFDQEIFSETPSSNALPLGFMTAFRRPVRESDLSLRSVPQAVPKSHNKLKRQPRGSPRKTPCQPAELHFNGAQVVRRPSDAFAPRPDSAISGLFSVDDPFHG